MQNKIKILLWVLLAVVLVFIMMAKGRLPRDGADISIITEKQEYAPGDNVRLKIRNGFNESIGFSLCYPYYLERQDGEWETYNYEECQGFNSNNYNIAARRSKFFELTLPPTVDGNHRLRIPVCVGCRKGDVFRNDLIFYSNEFQIQALKN